MPKYVVERELLKVGTFSDAELKGVSQQFCRALEEMGPKIQWIQSFVTSDKIYCVYIAPDEVMIRLHAANSGFPANQVNQVARIIDPTSAEM